MEESPEPTVIVKTLKDFNEFIRSGSKTKDSINSSPKLRLNFSAINESSSFLEESSLNAEKSRKRNADSMTGLDICKKFREKDGEIIGAKAAITRLEGRLHDVEMNAKKARLERDTEVDSLKRKQLRDKELIDDLQHKIKQSQARVLELEDLASKTKKECNTTTWEAESKMLRMQKEYHEKCNKLHEEVSTLRQKVIDLERKAEDMTSKAELAEAHVKELEQELRNAHQKFRDSETETLQTDTLKLQLDRAQAKIKELEMHQEELRGVEKNLSTYESTIRRLPVLEKELAKLRNENKLFKDTAVNTKLMEEKLANAQHQIKIMERRCEDAVQAKAKADMIKDTLQQYENIVMDEFGLEYEVTPAEFKTLLIKLREGDKTLTDGITQLRASQKSLEGSRASEEMQLKNLKAKLEQEQQNTQQNAQLIKRLQRKLILVTRERDGLKGVLSSYESEVTINHSAVSQERIVWLENQLESYQQEVQHLEEELTSSSKARVARPTVSEPRKEDAEKISSLEAKVLELQTEIEHLVHDKEVLELRLEARALKGDYDPTKTKILHFKNNPLAKAIEEHGTELEQLQKENEALRERVRLLEEGEHDITQKVGMKLEGDGPTSKEVTELKEKISSLEIRNKRLMDAFKRKSLEMREVVYRLTGYRVDMSGDNQYKLLNMYAESADDYLLFEQTANKELQLLQTEFSNSLEDLIDAYLHHENSYPAFLSAVTLDLFSRQARENPPPSPSDVEEEEEEEDEDEEEEEGEDEEEEEEEAEQPSSPQEQQQQELDQEAIDNDDDDDDLIVLD